MALPRVIFNATTGSDTAASGAGPSTAVTGPAAAHTGGVSSTTITLTNTPDLSTVAADGSAVLWLKTASGRQFSKITAVDDTADTVTVEDAFTIDEASAVDYAIGGKRATWDDADSRNVFADMKAGWRVWTETAQSLTSELAVSASGNSTDGFIQIGGDPAGSRQKITQTVNAAAISFSGDIWIARNMWIVNTAATKGSAYGIATDNSSGTKWVVNCELGDATDQLQNGLRRTSNAVYWRFIGCDIHDCIDDGVSQLGGAGECHAFSSRIVNNGGKGMQSSGNDGVVVGCIVAGNGGAGVDITSLTFAMNNTVDANGGDGFTKGKVFINNTITRNGGFGITTSNPVFLSEHNNFGTGTWANTSGAISGGSIGENDLQVDPEHADADAFDFSLQSTSPLLNAALQEI